jgi:hypothetical protein
MAKYRFVGTEEQARDFKHKDVYVGAILDEDHRLGLATVVDFAKSPNKALSEEWKEVINTTDTITLTSLYEGNEFAQKVMAYLDSMKMMLINKNLKYGNSALEPVRIFSKSDSKEQLYVRIDDKLSRIKNGSLDEDEDVVNDLIGYLVLLKVKEVSNA